MIEERSPRSEFGDRRGVGMYTWNRPPYAKGGDVEAGVPPLYPMMQESPALRWAFIRKIYAILTVQMLITIAVAAVVVYVRPVSRFFVSSGLGLYFLSFSPS